MDLLLQPVQFWLLYVDNLLPGRLIEFQRKLSAPAKYLEQQYNVESQDDEGCQPG